MSTACPYTIGDPPCNCKATKRPCIREIQTRLASDLESLAKDCEETAKEAMTLARAETTAESAEARAWLSMAYRIRHIAKQHT